MAGRDPKYVSDFKAFTKASLTTDDIPLLEAELYGTNARSCVVMMTALVESGLEAFVRQSLRPTLNSDDRRLLFDFVGPLGTFSSRTLVAYAFNLYGPETRHDLELIRVLRNGFAHSKKSFDFTTPQVAAVCAELKSPDWDGAYLPVGFLLKTASTESGETADSTNPRTRWLTACHTITDRLFRNAGRSDSVPGADLR